MAAHAWWRQVREGRLAARLPASFVPAQVAETVRSFGDGVAVANEPPSTEVIEIPYHRWRSRSSARTRSAGSYSCSAVAAATCEGGDGQGEVSPAP